MVDDDDFERVNQFKWYFNTYAVRNHWDKTRKKYKHIYMHRFITGADSSVVDHINGNPLDNRKSNLQVCNQSVNIQKAKRKGLPESGYKGVFIDKRSNRKKRYFSKISVNNKMVSLGYYATSKEASVAYLNAVAEYHHKAQR